MRGVQMGKVDSIEELPRRAEPPCTWRWTRRALNLHSAKNVLVNIASTTVFGAKYVQFVAPENPSPKRMQTRPACSTRRTSRSRSTQCFSNCRRCCRKIQPEKLNETLGAIATAFNGRGEKIGQMLSRPRRVSSPRPSPASTGCATISRWRPTVFERYADAAPDLLDTARTRHASASRSSRSRATSTRSCSARSAWRTSETTSSAATSRRSPTSCICWCRPRICSTSTAPP